MVIQPMIEAFISVLFDKKLDLKAATSPGNGINDITSVKALTISAVLNV